MIEYPEIFSQFAFYKRTIQNRSPLTVEQYLSDLAMFFRFVEAKRRKIPPDSDEAGQLELGFVDVSYCQSVSPAEVYDFFEYVANLRGNQARARARKLSSLRSFYKYLTGRMHYFENSPVRDVESPVIRPSLPKYLTEEESIRLLETIENDTESKNRIRDYCIITLFLNCGMRLSELCGISLRDLDPQLRSMRVIGKGSKERVIYLNDACKSALSAWLLHRQETEIIDKNALFISSRGRRISNKTVQAMVYKYLNAAGLGYRHLSVHKLRHTAATLMYQSGQVDVRMLKDILGHEQLNTTQIYTHVSSADMEKAMQQNPLAHIRRHGPRPDDREDADDPDEPEESEED